jgi:hypothetical protein
MGNSLLCLSSWAASSSAASRATCDPPLAPGEERPGEKRQGLRVFGDVRPLPAVAVASSIFALSTSGSMENPKREGLSGFYQLLSGSQSLCLDLMKTIP